MAATIAEIVFCLLLSAYCLLLSAYCFLPSAFCFLPCAFCLLPSAFFGYLLPKPRPLVILQTFPSRFGGRIIGDTYRRPELQLY